MRPHRSAAFAATMFAVLASPASAQVADDIVAEAAGPMLILPVDGSAGCRIDLLLGRTIGGRVAKPYPSCLARLPKVATVTAWFLGDGVHLIDGARRPVMTFTSDETGLPSSPSVADPLHYMVPARAGMNKVPTVKQTWGRWRMESARSPKKCNLTLIAPKPGDKGAHALNIGSDCPSGGFTSWRIEALTLFLEGPNDKQAAFEAVGDTRFEGPNGLRLVR